jgi:hypothetical protein
MTPLGVLRALVVKEGSEIRDQGTASAAAGNLPRYTF